jgi:DNA polymerase III sliding clamp (beta) subunit (PCNA family)
MTSITITLPVVHLRAALIFAGNGDVRYQLNGVYIHAGAKGARIVSTDGHTQYQANVPGNFPRARVIVPRALLDGIKWGKQEFVDVTIEPTAETSLVHNVSFALANGEVRTTQSIDGVFPDYARVVPDKLSGDVAYFDAEMLARTAKAAKLLGSKHGLYRVQYNGEGAALVMMPRAESIVLLMPLRVKTLEDQLHATPTWSRDAVE